MIIAEFELYYAEKGSDKKTLFSISITKPTLVDNDLEHKSTRVGFYFSKVEVKPFEEFSYSVYGADAMQAIHIASDIDFILDKLNKNYDLYCADGEPYF